MRTNRFSSYKWLMVWRKKIVNLPLEIWGIGGLICLLLVSVIIYLFSHSWGIIAFIITAAYFVLINTIRYVDSGEAMTIMVWGHPSDKVRENGLHLVLPIITYCDYFTVGFIRYSNMEMGDLDTKGDGFKLVYKYSLNLKIRKEMTFVYVNNALRGKQQEVLDTLNDTLLESSKDEAKRYSHEDLVEKDTTLQEKFKEDIEKSLILRFGAQLEKLCEDVIFPTGLSARNLYMIDLTIKDILFDKDYLAKLKEKKLAQMDVDIAKLDKQARIIDAEGKAEQIRIEGQAKADAVTKLGEAVSSHPEVVQYAAAENSNIQNILGEGANFLLGAGGLGAGGGKS